MRQSACLLLFLFLFICCKNGPDKVSGNVSNEPSRLADSFRTVNASLESSNKELNGKINYEFFYSQIKQKGDPHSDRVKRADSIYRTTGAVLRLIDTISKTLQDRDSIGDDTIIAGKLLLNTGLGDRLSRQLTDVYDRCYAGLAGKEKKPGLDSALTEIKEIKRDPNWGQQYFSNTPSVGAITVLQYLRLECVEAVSITLGDIYNSIE